MKYRFNQDDINRGKLVEPGLWYNVEVVKVYEDTCQIKGESVGRTNVDLQITDGNFKGAMLYVNFNEKYPSYMIPFLAAFGVEVKPDTDYDPESTVGRKLRVFVNHREWNNKFYNDVAAYKAAE